MRLHKCLFACFITSFATACRFAIQLECNYIKSHLILYKKIVRRFATAFRFEMAWGCDYINDRFIPSTVIFNLYDTASRGTWAKSWAFDYINTHYIILRQKSFYRFAGSISVAWKIPWLRIPMSLCIYIYYNINNFKNINTVKYLFWIWKWFNMIRNSRWNTVYRNWESSN